MNNEVADPVARLENWFWTPSPPARDVLCGEAFDDPPLRSCGPMELVPRTCPECRSASYNHFHWLQPGLTLLTSDRLPARKYEVRGWPTSCNRLSKEHLLLSV